MLGQPREYLTDENRACHCAEAAGLGNHLVEDFKCRSHRTVFLRYVHAGPAVEVVFIYLLIRGVPPAALGPSDWVTSRAVSVAGAGSCGPNAVSRANATQTRHGRGTGNPAKDVLELRN